VATDIGGDGPAALPAPDEPTAGVKAGEGLQRRLGLVSLVEGPLASLLEVIELLLVVDPELEGAVVAPPLGHFPYHLALLASLPDHNLKFAIWTFLDRGLHARDHLYFPSQAHLVQAVTDTFILHLLTLLSFLKFIKVQLPPVTKLPFPCKVEVLSPLGILGLLSSALHPETALFSFLKSHLDLF